MISEYITVRVFCRACSTAGSVPQEMAVVGDGQDHEKEATSFQCPKCAEEVVVVLAPIDAETVEAITTVHRPNPQGRRRKMRAGQFNRGRPEGGQGSPGGGLVN